MRRWLLAVLCVSTIAVNLAAQEPDAQLMQYIDTIKLVDNHAHVVAPDMEHDTNYDALRCETLPANASALAPANVRFGPDISGAWKALYGVSVDSDSPENLKKVDAGQKVVRDREKDKYFDWVLAQGGYDFVLANRVKMATELGAHFKWVPYDDALLFPLNNSALKTANPDRKILFDAEDGHLKEYLATAGLKTIPGTLDEYVGKVIVPTLQSQRKSGAVAIKYEVAYLRALDFEPAAHDKAAKIYARYVVGGTPSPAEYKLLQDYLFHAIGVQAGELGLAVHIHTGGGCGDYFDVRGSDPMLLVSVLNDPSLRKTNFVLLHGGSPFERHNTTLIAKPNVWVDTSVLELMFSPAELARILRPWLETMPERVIFGTDAGPFGPGFGWEETTYVASKKGRRAVALVLTEMMRDGVITRDRAKEIANDILRKNAIDLYKLQ
jgi:predicted TIM-barrel fold metal-dependent hydrolase